MQHLHFVENNCIKEPKLTNCRYNGKYIYVDYDNAVYKTPYSCQKIKDLSEKPFCSCDVNKVEYNYNLKHIRICLRDPNDINRIIFDLRFNEVKDSIELSTLSINLEIVKPSSVSQDTKNTQITKEECDAIVAGIIDEKYDILEPLMSRIISPNAFLSLKFLENNDFIGEEKIRDIIEHILKFRFIDYEQIMKEKYGAWSVSHLFKYMNNTHLDMYHTSIKNDARSDDSIRHQDALSVLDEYNDILIKIGDTIDKKIRISNLIIKLSKDCNKSITSTILSKLVDMI